jgi:hypothetical protein
VITAPPSLSGAVQDTTDCPLSPFVAETDVGAPATVDGTTEAEASEAVPVPATFVAVTVNEYEVPLMRPITVQNVPRVAVHENPPGFEVTVYAVIDEPPLDAGAVHETTDCPFAADVAVTAVATPGTPRGISPSDTRDATDEPDTFEAATVNVYIEPLVRPSTVHEVSAVTQVNPPGFEVTVYEVTAAPPSENGSDQDSVTEPLATSVIATSNGDEGTVDGTIAADTSEAPSPDTFTAATVNEYEFPLVSLVMMQLVAEVSQTTPPTEVRTTYFEIDAPPLLDGAVQDTTDWAFAAPVADTAIGTPGNVDGIAAADATEAAPVPLAFVAVTVNVYAVPFVRPVIVHGFTNTQETADCAVVAMYGVTVYPVIDAPPLLAGAVQDTTD